MFYTCGRLVAPVAPPPRHAAQPRQHNVKLPCHLAHDRRQNVRVSATTENAPISNPFTKTLMSWAGSFTGLAGKRERIVYSSVVPSGPHLLDVAKIWAREFDRPVLRESTASTDLGRRASGIAQVEKALKNSFRVSAAYAEITEIRNGERVCISRKLIGCARCVSDGYFAAQVVDCCVDVPYQRRGIGTRLLRTLCKDTREAGAQSIAVFSAPDSRLFFWKAGFRMDFRCAQLLLHVKLTLTVQHMRAISHDCECGLNMQALNFHTLFDHLTRMLLMQVQNHGL
jgi:ribosomal protein S18 acetylase RimI-like enzyme